MEELVLAVLWESCMCDQAYNLDIFNMHLTNKKESGTNTLIFNTQNQ